MSRRPIVRVSACLLVVGALLAACSGDDGGGSDDAAATSSTTVAPTTGAAPVTTSSPGAGCGPAGERTTPEGPSATTETLSEGGDGEPRVEAVVHPRPDHEGNPWSQWGQGIVLPDGRFLSAIGDHLGEDGNSYFYAFDPSTSTLTQFADAQQVLGHEEGAWGYGKIHAQMTPGLCGDVYVTTYWGDSTDIRYEAGYEGDALLRIDADTLAIDSLGVPMPQHGLPSLAGWEGRFLFGEAVDPSQEDTATFYVYDLVTGEVVFTAEDDNPPWRTVLVRPDGTAYFSAGQGRLYEYDREAGTVDLADQELPGGGRLRAVTRPGPDGTVYGVTDEPEVFFAMDPEGEMSELGPARGYTASLALDPTGQHLYYVPGAHGDSHEQGTPLIRVDTTTGEEEVVVELNELSEEHLGLTLGGTYNVVMDPSGDRVYLGMNAGTGEGDGEEAVFGEVVLVSVDLT